jgi:hypothetical protein
MIDTHEIGVFQIGIQVLDKGLASGITLHSLNEEVENHIRRHDGGVSLVNLKESFFELANKLLGIAVVVLVLKIDENLETLEITLPG